MPSQLSTNNATSPSHSSEPSFFRRIWSFLGRTIFLCVSPVVKPIKRRVINAFSFTINEAIQTIHQELEISKNEMAKALDKLNAVLSYLETNNSDRLHTKQKIDSLDFRVNLIKAGMDFTTVEVGKLSTEAEIFFKDTQKSQTHFRVVTDLINTEIVALRQKIYEILSGITSTRIDLKTSNARLDGITEVTKKTETAVYEHKADVSSIKASADELCMELKSLKADIVRLTPTLAQQGETLNFSSNALDLLKKEISVQQSKLGKIENYAHMNARHIFAYCGNNVGIIRSDFGYLALSTNDFPLLAGLMDSAGDLEKGTRILIESILKHSLVFVDIGANIGVHTIAAAQILKSRKGLVYAFEPYQPTVRLLEQSVSINGLNSVVQVIPKGISNKNTQHELYLGATSSHHSLYPLGSKAEKTKVDLVRLDTVIDGKKIIDLIKIAVEGHELAVLESAIPFIKNNDQIILIVEFASFHLARIGVSANDWVKKFTDLGLIYKWIEPFTGELQTRTLDDLIQLESSNLLLAKPHAAIWNMK